MSDVFWSVDSLVVRENALFGFGWAFHQEYEITALRLRLTFSGKGEPWVEHIVADAGKPREDVERAFPNQSRALHSGYVVYGAFPTGARLDSIHLVCLLGDDSVVELVVPASNVLRYSSDTKAVHNCLMLRQFYVLLRRGVRLIRSGKFTSLFEKIGRYIKGRPKTALHKPSDLLKNLREEECKDISLIIDHDLGGGANHYRDRLVDSIIGTGRGAMILTFHVATLTHMLIVRNSRITTRYSIPDNEFIVDLIRHISVKEIIYNTAVSFVRPEEIPHLLIRLKKTTSACLKVLVHDFFLVCPSHFLIDHSGRHCHIPEVSVCSRCLPKNQHGFTTLFVDRDMATWRSIWGSALAIADEIVTFSNNTSKLLLKAYPQVAGSKVFVVPHKVYHLTGKIPTITNTGKLCIGIVGHIGLHKGSVFVKALAQEIKRRNVDLKIVVIGTIEASCEPSVVVQTGTYRHEEMPDLIESTGVNVMFFPSIWPETFSYTIQELMEMNLPITSFNFGAPAERLASYRKGLVLESMDPGRVLEDLISFHCKTYLAN